MFLRGKPKTDMNAKDERSYLLPSEMNLDADRIPSSSASHSHSSQSSSVSDPVSDYTHRELPPTDYTHRELPPTPSGKLEMYLI